MGPSGPSFKFIYHDDTIYEDGIYLEFILVHKSILIIS